MGKVRTGKGREEKEIGKDVREGKESSLNPAD